LFYGFVRGCSELICGNVYWQALRAFRPDRQTGFLMAGKPNVG